MQIYVDGNAVRSGNGQKEYPFQTISEAAKIAMPGDEVLVAPGVYREYVDPANAGCEDCVPFCGTGKSCDYRCGNCG